MLAARLANVRGLAPLANMPAPLQKLIASRYARPQPSGRARAARRRRASRCPRRPRSTSIARTLARAEGARVARAGPAGSRLRAQRHRFHRQRPTRAGDRRARWSAMIAHGRDSARRARWRLRLHQLRSNRSNIAHHYDVSNAFYRLWLDARMVYSCAYFQIDDDTLDEAQAQKLDHICRKLRLAPGERFLDIGCGWGALILWAARALRRARRPASRCRRTSTTTCARRSPRCGLGDRVRVELLRLRRAARRRRVYDKIASVGMFEHVGVARLPALFRQDLPRSSSPAGSCSTTASRTTGSARKPGQRHRRLRRGVRVSRRAARACLARDRGAGGAGAGGRRRRGAARALRAHAVALGRPARGERGRRPRARSARRGSASGASTWPVRRTPSTAAGCRYGSCSPASRSPTAVCRIR